MFEPASVRYAARRHARPAARFALAALLALSACGRDEPRLFAVVATPGDAPDACLPLRTPDLEGLPAADLDRLRIPAQDYFWVVGETLEGPRGWQSAFATISGRPALVSVTSSAGGITTTRAAAALEGGRVAHTWFGTPLTPALAFEDGLQLSLTFDAQLLDAPAYEATKAVLDAVSLETAAYRRLLDAVSPPAPTERKVRALSQTWVLRDPRSCASGACSAVIAAERLVLLAASARTTARELAAELCLQGSRLVERDGGDEHDGVYAVLRVAHARLPEEALGAPLADALAALARCDHAFAPELASRAADALSRAPTLRAADREALQSLLDDAAVAARATGAESRLEAERRLARSSQELCARTPAEGIACSRARAIAACATARVASASPLRAPWLAAVAAADEAERAVSSAGACPERGPAAVALGRELASLAAATRQTGLGGACSAGEPGLSCEAFPELSRRSRATVSELQDVIYRACWCPAVRQDTDPAPVSRLVRQALACTGTPEDLALSVPAEVALGEADLAAWRARLSAVAPPYTAGQCPACARLTRRVDDELARAVALGRHRAAVAELLQRALSPVSDLHDRAFMLLAGDAAPRCAGRPAEWSVVARALDFSVQPRDVFGPAGQVEPGRLEARLREARWLAEQLETLPCVRETPVPAPSEPGPRAVAGAPAVEVPAPPVPQE